ncbi:MAG: PhnD/SsuA/transferrin family substrate-binding protein [Bryobacterales bacterium]|nr:PhnD/SsuA/transferrin family substrate-binding protein [Bryobacterales bacterium]
MNRAEYRRRSFLAALLGLPGAAAAQEPAAQMLRFGLSDSLRGDINVADARSAMAVWFRRIEQDMKVDLRYDPNVFDDVERLAIRLRQRQLDAVALNVIEYRRLLPLLDPDSVTIPVLTPKLQYVLLVRADAGVSRLADLQGRRLVLLETPHTCLGPAWLSTLLDAQSQVGHQRFFSSMAKKSKPAQAVLPVFFGQAEACLTTFAGFQAMGELNPQVSHRLRVLETSPELVTTLYAYRRDWKGVARDAVTRGLEDLRTSPAGRQILTMFQCQGMMTSKSTCFQSAFAILAQAERIAAREGGTL